MNIENKEIKTKTAESNSTATATPVSSVDENAIVLDAAEQAKGKKLKRRFNVTEGVLHIKSTLNNTIATICDMSGNKMKQESAGMSFKGSKKGTPYAAYIVADKLARWAALAGIKCVDIRANGIGNGKDMVIRTVHQRGLLARSICDVTPVPHGGCRARKARRT